jgi:hypothetical protein
MRGKPAPGAVLEPHHVHAFRVPAYDVNAGEALHEPQHRVQLNNNFAQGPTAVPVPKWVAVSASLATQSYEPSSATNPPKNNKPSSAASSPFSPSWASPLPGIELSYSRG